ncbi:NUDIX hydrolase [Streptomyces sp. CAU 1734]|uniref:NUDIX hydrolase n=1 Tax=Streptomyces sp. CAU 1734 TaxID=3140360 RepID=UPI003260AC02
MTVSDSHIVKAITGYLHRYPVEAAGLMPVYDAAHDHTAHGRCTHRDRCPLVVAVPILVDERERVLGLLRPGGRPFADGPPVAGDRSLHASALRVLREYTGVEDVWTLPGTEEPLDIEVRAGCGRRLIGLRYLFRGHARMLPAARLEGGGFHWLAMSEAGDRLAERLRPWLTSTP